MFLYAIPITLITHNDQVPSNIEIISVDNNQNLLIKYYQGKIYFNRINNKKYSLANILYEYIHGSHLWKIEYSLPIYLNTNGINICYSLNINVHINSFLIPDYINKSLGLLNILADEFTKLKMFESASFPSKSFISYNEPHNTDDRFKIQLYDYQKRNLSRMINIENNQNFSMVYTIPINIDEHILLYNPILNKYTETENTLTIRTSGGIISDAVGMGKTFTTLSLIVYNTSQVQNKVINNKLYSKATVIICPSHLVSQWKTEMKRCIPKAKIVCILTKTSHSQLLFKDFINADIIITSQQFLMNFSYYPTLYYRGCTPSSVYISYRKKILEEEISNLLNTKTYEELLEHPKPIFEFFKFHRLVIDEGHEIFAGLLSSHQLNKYMSEWLLTMDADYRWYVSGTPFISMKGLIVSSKFINMELTDEKNNIHISMNDDTKTSNSIISEFIEKDYFWDRVFKNICIRHNKDDVSDQIYIPGYTEDVIWLELTPMERELYNINATRRSRMNLQKLCCHLLMLQSTKKIFGDNALDLSVMQDTLIAHHKKQYTIIQAKITALDANNPAYGMLKKAFETQLHESKYLYTILEKMKSTDNIDEDCSICISTILKPTLTKCGHLYCFECIKSSMNFKKECPTCRKPLLEKELMLVEKREEKEEKTNVSSLIAKYGSKLGYIINCVSEIVSDINNRVIIFSQWDDMLNIVSSTLKENNIHNTIVKGNAVMRDSAVSKFKEGSKSRVIMLSLKNSASGTNLTQATHIIFIEPVDAPKEEIKLIENQAIGRACRIGQTNTVKIVRILIKDTIEEEIYNNYNS
jgi:SNF2 family DNA or RNA helicase